MLRGLLVHHRGISIWKIGRASIGMEISSVTEPTIINLGKQCAETKEYIFFYSPPLLPPLPFAPVSNHVRMHHERVKLQTTRVHVQRAKYDPPIFLPFFIFSSVFPLPLFPSSIFLFLVPSSNGFSFVPETFVPRRIKAGRPEPWEIRDK